MMLSTALSGRVLHLHRPVLREKYRFLRDFTWLACFVGDSIGRILMAAETTLAVVAYHRPGQLSDLLASLRGSEDVLRCLVVNVESDPAVKDVAEAFGAQSLEFPSNLGYAAAVNAAASLVETETVIFANDDISCSSTAFLELARVVSQGEADVAVPLVSDETGKPVRTIQAVPTASGFFWEWILLPDKPVPLLDRLLRVQKWRQPSRREVVEAASGIVVATRTELLRRIPLPEEYFMYFEESEWFADLRRSPGSKVLYCPDIEVVHYGGRGLVNDFKSKAQARSAVLFMKRRYGSPLGSVFSAAVVVWQARLVATAGVRLLKGGSAGVLRARLAGLKAALAAVVTP